MQHLPLGCLVMASGQSKRFGSNKLLAPFGEKPLLAYTLSQIPKELFSRCIVVTRTPECCPIAVNAGFTPILHALPLRRDAVRLGIEQMEGMAGCLVVQADQPLCLPQSYKNLVEHFYQHPQGFFALVGSPPQPAQFYSLHTPSESCAPCPKNQEVLGLCQKIPQILRWFRHFIHGNWRTLTPHNSWNICYTLPNIILIDSFVRFLVSVAGILDAPAQDSKFPFPEQIQKPSHKTGGLPIPILVL